MQWISAYSIVLVVFLVAVGVLVGRMRGESRSMIAMNIVGTLLFLGGIAWSISLGQQAFGAVAVATLGVVLFSMASERSRGARASRSSPPA
jgi:hypothetical protein